MLYEGNSFKNPKFLFNVEQRYDILLGFILLFELFSYPTFF